MLSVLAELSPEAARHLGYMLIGIVIFGLCLFHALCLIPGIVFAPLLEHVVKKSGLYLSKKESWFSATLICAEILGPMCVVLMYWDRLGLDRHRQPRIFVGIQIFTISYSFLYLVWIGVLYRRHQYTAWQGIVLLLPFVMAILCMELIALTLWYINS